MNSWPHKSDHLSATSPFGKSLNSTRENFWTAWKKPICAQYRYITFDSRRSKIYTLLCIANLVIQKSNANKCSNVWPSTRFSDRFQISLLGYTLRLIFIPLVANVLMSWQLHRHDQAAHFVFFFSRRILPRISSYQIICTVLGQHNGRVEALHLAIENVEYLWYF
jgi:hypothetical protein